MRSQLINHFAFSSGGFEINGNQEGIRSGTGARRGPETCLREEVLQVKGMKNRGWDKTTVFKYMGGKEERVYWIRHKEMVSARLQEGRCRLAT